MCIYFLSDYWYSRYSSSW